MEAVILFTQLGFAMGLSFRTGCSLFSRSIMWLPFLNCSRPCRTVCSSCLNALWSVSEGLLQTYFEQFAVVPARSFHLFHTCSNNGFRAVFCGLSIALVLFGAVVFFCSTTITFQAACFFVKDIVNVFRNSFGRFALVLRCSGPFCSGLLLFLTRASPCQVWLLVLACTTPFLAVCFFSCSLVPFDRLAPSCCPFPFVIKRSDAFRAICPNALL